MGEGRGIKSQLSILLLGAALASGCGGVSQTANTPAPSPSPSAAGPPILQFTTTVATSQPEGSVKVVMKGIKYDPTALNAKTVKAAFYLVNQEPVKPEECPVAKCFHDMVIKDTNGYIVARSEQVQPGEARVFIIETIPAGKYSFYCSVGAHFQQYNQAGTLTVE